ncbi:MAG: hypothetical protein HGB10_02135 [Coriobacteriia bacterium]|nr:hypothetical protein [Coriobacteriia bacterium]
MDSASAVEQLRSKLESSFGKSLAMMIIIAASSKVGVSTIGMDREQFTRLAEAVANDQRVRDMWGAAGAAEAAAEWRRLVA